MTSKFYLANMDYVFSEHATSGFTSVSIEGEHIPANAVITKIYCVVNSPYTYTGGTYSLSVAVDNHNFVTMVSASVVDALKYSGAYKISNHSPVKINLLRLVGTPTITGGNLKIIVEYYL